MSKRRAEDDASFWSAKAIRARQEEKTWEKSERAAEKAREKRLANKRARVAAGVIAKFKKAIARAETRIGIDDVHVPVAAADQPFTATVIESAEAAFPGCTVYGGPHVFWLRFAPQQKHDE